MTLNNGFTPGLHTSMPEALGTTYARTIVLTENDPAPSRQALAHLMNIVLSADPRYIAMTYTYSDNTLSLQHDKTLPAEAIRQWVDDIMDVHREPVTAADIVFVRDTRTLPVAMAAQTAR